LSEHYGVLIRALLIVVAFGNGVAEGRKKVPGCCLTVCRLHGKGQRISVGINDCILTEDLSTIKEGIPMAHGLNNQ